MKRIYYVLLILAVLAGPGCKNSKTNSDSRDKKMKIATNKSGVSLPDNLPKDVPIYPGSTANMTNQVQGINTVVLETSASLEKVVSFYEDKIKANGWKVNVNTKLAAANTIQASKDGDRKLIVTVVKKTRDGKTSIMLQYK